VKRAYTVTTPIYYANAEPHIGHTYTTVVVDTLVRWHRAQGEQTWSVSGTDEHGEKMVEAAALRGLDPARFTEQISAVHQRTWAELGLSVSRFVRTTDPAHVRNVQALLQRVYDAGWIEPREYEGLYCVGCERFLTERDMEGGLCRDHERKPEPRRERNYFFLMSREFGWLRQHIQDHPGFIRPERYRNEALAMLRDESGLGDLSISRPKTRLDWGIELPFDREHVCYVWFDALISYLTGAGFPDHPDFAARWANVEHLIGKDILKPHAVFWPIMLKAMGLPPYSHLSVHGYWTVEGRKISKSLGNTIPPLEMRDRYGFEAFRYFLLREMSFGNDANFSEAGLVERVNADLANNLGNLVSRTLNLSRSSAAG
jgi:methionyl-tRNA synthetase